MNVREIAASELSNLLELYQHLDAKDDSVPDMDIVETIWQELRVSPYHRYFGAYLDGRLVSSCALTLVPSLRRGYRPYGLIENVVTDPDYRKQGFATAVLKKALELLVMLKAALAYQALVSVESLKMLLETTLLS